MAERQDRGQRHRSVSRSRRQAYLPQSQVTSSGPTVPTVAPPQAGQAAHSGPTASPTPGYSQAVQYLPGLGRAETPQPPTGPTSLAGRQHEPCGGPAIWTVDDGVSAACTPGLKVVIKLADLSYLSKGHEYAQVCLSKSVRQ